MFEYFAGVNTCAPKACLLNPLGLGLQVVALWVLGRKPEFFARAQVFLTFEPISPALRIAGFVGLCPRAPVLGTKTSDMVFFREL